MSSPDVLVGKIKSEFGWVPEDVHAVRFLSYPGRGTVRRDVRSGKLGGNARVRRDMGARTSLRRLDLSLAATDIGGPGWGHQARRARHQHAAATAASSATGRRG